MSINDTQKTNKVGDELVQCLPLSSFQFNDLSEHYSNDHFHSFMSKRLLVLLTAPLMDLRKLLSALKCITINVICYRLHAEWYVYLETNLAPGQKMG